MSGRIRQREPEIAAGRHAVIDSDRTSVRLHGELAERQAQAHGMVAATVPRFDGAELLENLGAVIRRHAGAAVAYLHAGTLRHACDYDAQRAALRCVLEAIADEVHEDSTNERCVATDLHGSGSFDLEDTLGFGGTHTRTHLVRDAREIANRKGDGHPACF